MRGRRDLVSRTSRCFGRSAGVACPVAETTIFTRGGTGEDWDEGEIQVTSTSVSPPTPATRSYPWTRLNAIASFPPPIRGLSR